MNIFSAAKQAEIDDLMARLIKDNLTVAAAESCTAGMLTSIMGAYPGISSVLMGGFVTYANYTKQQLVGVRNETLETYGAVSPQTASEMARGAAKTLNTDIGISTTGVAGPGGGTADKPVGLVYIACSYNGVTAVRRLMLSGNRNDIRTETCYNAFILIYECLERGKEI